MSKNEEGVKIAIVGDCSNWNQRGVNRDDIPLEIRDKIMECDIFIFDLEGPIINDQIVTEGVIKNSLVKKFLDVLGKLQPVVTNTESLLDVLNLAKINVACLANNHILDAGKEGVCFTLESLKKRNFLFLGAGKTISDASKPLIIEINRKKIGILNYNFVGWGKFGFFIDIFGASQKRAGANHGSKKRITKDLKNLSERVDYVIAVMHIGRYLHETLSLKEQDFLESFEADLIITHHAHITQSIKNKKIISCGDFLFSYPNHLPCNRKSRIILLNIKKDGTKKMNLIETNINQS